MSLAEARLADLMDKWFIPKDMQDLPDAPKGDIDKILEKWKSSDSVRGDGSFWVQMPADGGTVFNPGIYIPNGSTIQPYITATTATWGDGVSSYINAGGSGTFTVHGSSGGVSNYVQMPEASCEDIPDDFDGSGDGTES